MRANQRRLWLSLTVILVAAATAPADEFSDLLKRIPSQANALLMLDVTAMHQSPLGIKQNWTRRHEQDYATGVSSIPPTISKLVIGAQMNPTTLEPNWKVSVAHFKQDRSLAEVVRVRGGKLDKVENTDVAVLSQNVYAVAFAPDEIALWFPANRQEFGRYLRFARRNQSVGLSPYLQQAAQLGSGTQGMMAMDMTDVLDPEGVRRRLQSCKALAAKKVDLDQFTRLICGLQGVRLAISVDDAMHGEIRLNFSDDAGPLVDFVKPIVLEAMGGMGSAVDDLEGWHVRPEEKAIVLYGEMTLDGAHKLFSFLLTPATAAQSAPGGPSSEPDDPAQASLKYYKSLSAILNDLKREKPKSWSQQAHWYYMAGQKIDELPILNVDDTLLKVGQMMSATIRNLCNLSRQVGNQMYNLRMQAQGGVQTVGNYVPYGYAGYYGGGWGWGYAGSTDVNMAQAAAFAAQANSASESKIRDQTWNNIDDTMVALRRTLTEKYKLEF